MTTKKQDNNVATKVNAASKLINIEELTSGSALAKPDLGDTDLLAPEPEPEPPSTENLNADDYVGDAADRTGFSGLEAVDEVTMVAVPDLAAAYEQGAIDLETFKAVQLGGDRTLRADGRPGRDPGHAART